MDVGDLAAARTELLAWFDAHRRDLPWRVSPGQAPDPYRIWLSEVMLQQTRVETVRPYFDRWVARFPDLESLAVADQNEVLKAWEGLGYYSRARNFHAAVREVIDRYGGRVPGDAATFRSLPGVGRYTAGAVMSIAFGKPEPIVDGNVRRVFARLLDRAEPAEAELWALASRFAAGPRPGDLNQALMELGATVCTPRTPGCERCPVADRCLARARGTQRDRPVRSKAKVLPVEHHAVAVIEVDDRVLVVRRPPKGRLAGMWELPGVRIGVGESAGDAARRAARELAGAEVEVGWRLVTIRHRFTHVVVDYQAFIVSGEVPAPPGSDGGLAWIARDGSADLAMPVAQHRILERLRAMDDPSAEAV